MGEMTNDVLAEDEHLHHLKLKVTVGPRNASTNKASGLRTYRWKGVDYPSVTSIRAMAGYPIALHEWSIKQITARVVDEYPKIGRMLKDPAPEAVAATRSWLRAAAIEARDKAASLGTRVHDAAARNVPISEVSEDVKPYYRQYLDWKAVSGVELLFVERQIWNLRYGFAGTFDLMARFRDGSIWIVDIKTGNGIYTDHALQCVAYALGEFIGEDDVVDAEATELLRHVSGIAILHLGPAKWEWVQVVVTEELWHAFRGLLVFARFVHAHPRIKSLVRGARTGSSEAA